MDFETLTRQGWATIQFADPSERSLRKEMSSLAGRLGRAVPVRTGGDLFTVLTPTTTAAAHARSLSRKFSLGEFELHNDTAHWITPCRYIVIACVDTGDGGRPTLLLDSKTLPLTRDEVELMQTAPMRILNGRTSFFSTILSQNRPFLRFDVGCMTGATPEASAALNLLKKERWKKEVQEFHWQPGIGLVIDNWRVLHGRGSACRDDPQRLLLRLSFL